MHRLIILVLSAPFWLQFLFAGGAFWGAWQYEKHLTAQYEARLELAKSQPPAEVSISDFTPLAAKGMPEEVNVRVQVASQHSVRLIKKTNGIKTGESLLYILVDPAAEAGDRVARGAIVIDPDDLDAFADWMIDRTLSVGSFGPAGPVLSLPGLVDHPSNASHANDAIKNRGFTRARNFEFIKPFLKGREAGLAVTPHAAGLATFGAFVPGTLFLLLGVGKLVAGRRKVGADAPETAVPSAREARFEKNAVAEDAMRARLDAIMGKPAAGQTQAGDPGNGPAALGDPTRTQINAMMDDPKMTRQDLTTPGPNAGAGIAKKTLPFLAAAPQPRPDMTTNLASWLKGGLLKVGMVISAFGLYFAISMSGSSFGLETQMRSISTAGKGIEAPIARPSGGGLATMNTPIVAPQTHGDLAQAKQIPTVPENVQDAPDVRDLGNSPAPVSPGLPETAAEIETPDAATVASDPKPAPMMVKEPNPVAKAAGAVSKILIWFQDLPKLTLLIGLGALILVAALVALRPKGADATSSRPDPFERLLEQRRKEMERQGRA